MAFLTAARHRLDRLLRAWIAILLALYAATALTGLTLIVALSLRAPGDAGLASALAWFPLWFVTVAICSIVFALIFAVLATPFLMLQRFIVGPQSPYLRPGYAAVALYGPALVILADGGWRPEDLNFCAMYEIIALVATLIYVRLASHLGLFPPSEPHDAVAAS